MKGILLLPPPKRLLLLLRPPLPSLLLPAVMLLLPQAVDMAPSGAGKDTDFDRSSDCRPCEMVG